jgi:hypothetical protein
VGVLPDIQVNNRDLLDLSADCAAALLKANEPPFLFQRGGKVVRIRTDENGHSSIEPVSAAFLTACLSEAANFYRVTRSGERGTATRPPLAAVRVLLACPEMWDLPRDPGASPAALTEKP